MYRFHDIFKQVHCISANADGRRDVASRRIGNVALHIMCDYLQTSSDIEITLPPRPTQLSVISTCVLGDTQTPLGRFVDDILYKQVCNKFTTHRTSGA